MLAHRLVITDICRRFDWRAIFGNDNPVELDLGAGDGGFAITYAQQHPEVNLLAVERLQVLGAWERLKACPAEDCEWAFFDVSRNRSRTWCSMEECGNRAKTRRYRRRKGSG